MSGQDDEPQPASGSNKNVPNRTSSVPVKASAGAFPSALRTAPNWGHVTTNVTFRSPSALQARRDADLQAGGGAVPHSGRGTGLQLVEELLRNLAEELVPNPSKRLLPTLGEECVLGGAWISSDTIFF